MAATFAVVANSLAFSGGPAVPRWPLAVAATTLGAAGLAVVGSALASRDPAWTAGALGVVLPAPTALAASGAVWNPWGWLPLALAVALVGVPLFSLGYLLTGPPELDRPLDRDRSPAAAERATTRRRDD